MDDTLHQGDGIGGRHGSARNMAERALAAEARGDQEEADRLFAQAERIDPEAVAAVLSERRGKAGDVAATQDQGPQRDDEVAAITRTVTGRDTRRAPGSPGQEAGRTGKGRRLGAALALSPSHVRQTFQNGGAALAALVRTAAGEPAPQLAHGGQGQVGQGVVGQGGGELLEFGRGQTCGQGVEAIASECILVFPS